MITWLKPIIDQDERFQDTDTGREYRRIVGGIGWPTATLPGFAVVVGEAKQVDGDMGERLIYVLAEIEDELANSLLGRCLGLRSIYQVRHWYGDTRDRVRLALVNQINQGMDVGNKLVFHAAPYSKDAKGLVYYHSLIHQATLAGQKTLYLGNAPKLIEALTQADMAAIEGQDHSELPAVAALGYALSEIKARQPAAVQATVQFPDFSPIKDAWML